MHARDLRPIALVGLSGAGKSAVAARLGARHGLDVADLDAMIEASARCSIADYFERQGEAAFRRRETEALARALDQRAAVIACGGGVVLDAANRERLRRECRVVWLEVGADAAVARVGDGAGRPLLAGGSAAVALDRLRRERSALYEEVAMVRVLTDDATVDEVAERVWAALAGVAS